MSIRGDASEFRRLAADLSQAGPQALPVARAAIQTGAALVKTAWQANARATAGDHGKHYPNAITFETRTLASAAVGEVGPESSRPQGGMGPGFELGSRNQPPHLDGLRAVDQHEATIESALSTQIGRVIP